MLSSDQALYSAQPCLLSLCATTAANQGAVLRQVYPREESVHLQISSTSNSEASFGFYLPPNALVVLHLTLNWDSIGSQGPVLVSRARAATVQ